METALNYHSISTNDQFLLAKTYLQLGENKKAVNKLSVIHKENPSFTPAIFELAAQYVKGGNTLESVNYYRKGLKIDPNNIKASNNLAWLLATSSDENIKNADEALVIANKIVKITGNKNPDTLDTLAAALAAKGRYNEAVKILEKAIGIINSSGNKALLKDYEKRLKSYKDKASIDE